MIVAVYEDLKASVFRKGPKRTGKLDVTNAIGWGLGSSETSVEELRRLIDAWSSDGGEHANSGQAAAGIEVWSREPSMEVTVARALGAHPAFHYNSELRRLAWKRSTEGSRVAESFFQTGRASI